jgi:hypothetical protein
VIRKFILRPVWCVIDSVDVFLFLDALGRQLERPRKKHRDREPEQQQEQHGLADPLGGAKRVERNVSDLSQQPGGYRVGDGDPEDVSSFQFFEKAHGPPGRAMP